MPPRGGNPLAVWYAFFIQNVSTHAPARGQSAHMFILLKNQYYVSTHAPARGQSSVWTSEKPEKLLEFQLMPPRGGNPRPWATKRA